MQRSARNIKGFTLVELLVVVAILAVLAVVAVSVFSVAQNSVRNGKVNADFNTIYRSIEQARTFQQKTLGQIISGETCSACSCRSPHPANAKPGDPDIICLTKMNSSFALIEPSLSSIRDPWGNIYMWDENEGEGGGCGRDDIISVGPDHFQNTADDKMFWVPLSKFSGCP